MIVVAYSHALLSLQTESQMSDRELKIRVITPKPQPIPIRGGFGGVTQDKLVLLQLYSEYPTLPSTMTHPVGDDGVVDLTQFEADNETHLTRVIEIIATMSPRAAREVGAWLIQRADEAEGTPKPTPEEVTDDSN